MAAASVTRWGLLRLCLFSKAEDNSLVGSTGLAALATSRRWPCVEEILKCQFSNWCASFRNLDQKRSNVSIKSVVIRPLSSDFLESLQSDGVRLPLGATNVLSCAPSQQAGEDDDDETRTPRQFSFPERSQQIEDGIEKLGGAVVPKRNLSSPKDATWINNGSLKCETVCAVYRLLKSSDFVMHDSCRAVEPSDDDDSSNLVLRKWCNLHPSVEFR